MTNVIRKLAAIVSADMANDLTQWSADARPIYTTYREGTPTAP